MPPVEPAPPLEIPTRLPAVRLCAWAPRHRDALVREADDPAVWRNLFHTFPHPYTVADAQAWIALSARAAPSLHLCIEVDGMAAGGIGIDVGEGTEQKTGRFGYWLGRRHWGRGIASAAGAALVAHLCTLRVAGPSGRDASAPFGRPGGSAHWRTLRFAGPSERDASAPFGRPGGIAHALQTMGLARLEAPVFAWNPASMRVLEKLGFEREGVLRHSVYKDGQLIDSVMYALLLSDADAAGAQ